MTCNNLKLASPRLHDIQDTKITNSNPKNKYILNTPSSTIVNRLEKSPISIVDYAEQIITQSKRINNQSTLTPQTDKQATNKVYERQGILQNGIMDRYRVLFPKTFNCITAQLYPGRETTTENIQIYERTKRTYSFGDMGKQTTTLQRFPTAVTPDSKFQSKVIDETNVLAQISNKNFETNMRKNMEKVHYQKKTSGILISTQNPNPQQPQDNLVKERFPGYEVITYLGKGKFSEVYLAKQRETDFRVALKVIQKSLIKEQNMEKQLAWEIKIQYLLRHPNIVRLYTILQNEKEIVLVLEYCADGQLYEALKVQPNQRYDESTAKGYIKQVTSALAFLHANDVIHRDIKPENILLSFVLNNFELQGQAKLADFSFCVYSPSQNRQTRCGSMVYSSPEQVSGEEYDKKSDVWALGVLAYELCEGQTPWEDMSKLDAMQMIQSVYQFSQQQANFSCPPHFSTGLLSFIESLTKKKPKDRINARQALYHPWLAQIRENSTLIKFTF